MAARSSFGLWTGAIFCVTGLVLLYFGIDFPNTNMSTFIYPEFIGGALFLTGIGLLALGLVRIAAWAFGIEKTSSRRT